ERELAQVAGRALRPCSYPRFEVPDICRHLILLIAPRQSSRVPVGMCVSVCQVIWSLHHRAPPASRSLSPYAHRSRAESPSAWRSSGVCSDLVALQRANVLRALEGARIGALLLAHTSLQLAHRLILMLFHPGNQDLLDPADMVHAVLQERGTHHGHVG